MRKLYVIFLYLITPPYMTGREDQRSSDGHDLWLDYQQVSVTTGGLGTDTKGQPVLPTTYATDGSLKPQLQVSVNSV